MNDHVELSVIVNGTRYDSVKVDKVPEGKRVCDMCDVTEFDCECMYVCPLGPMMMFRKSGKTFEK